MYSIFLLRYSVRAAIFFTFCSVFMISSWVGATEIQRVISKGGIEAWLVEDHTMPIISTVSVFQVGTSSDPDEHIGVSNMLTTMLNEGAGELDAAAFQGKLEELAVHMSFKATLDGFAVSMKTLTRNADEAFQLLSLALSKPRFDPSSVERMRTALLSQLRIAQDMPQVRAQWQWFNRAFGTHPYARPGLGTLEGIQAIDAEALRAAHARIFLRNRLKIGVVGDIDADRLKTYLDNVFAVLPDGKEIIDQSPVQSTSGPWIEKVEMDIPQTVVMFGHTGISHKHKDFYPAYVLNDILGGHSLTSRLFKEVREERGLAYSIGTWLYLLDRAPLFLGSFATKKQSFEETLSIVRAELKRMATDGPTKKELEAAKSYLKGSYVLRFDTNDSIASELVNIQLHELGIDHIKQYDTFIDAVTHEQVVAVAARFLQPDNLMVTVVGSHAGSEQSRSSH